MIDVDLSTTAVQRTALIIISTPLFTVVFGTLLLLLFFGFSFFFVPVNQ